jgi:hypothetical protein
LVGWAGLEEHKQAKPEISIIIIIIIITRQPPRQN